MSGVSSILRRSPYNLRPRTVRVTAYQAYIREKNGVLVSTDLDTAALAARAQERHELYMAGEQQEVDEPEVEDAVSDAGDGWSPEMMAPLSAFNSFTAAASMSAMSSTTTCADDTPPTSILSAGGSRRKARNKNYSKAKKRDNRSEGRRNERYSPYVGRTPKQHSKEKTQQARKLESSFSFDESVKDRASRVAQSAFVGTRLKTTDYPTEPIGKAEGIEWGLDELDWDGESDLVIVDCQGRAIVHLGRKSANIESLLERVEVQFERVSQSYQFKPAQVMHRRGKFKAVPCGLSYGGGQTHVGNLKDTPNNRAVIEEHLLHNADVINLAGFVDCAFQNAAEELHTEYGRILESICDKHPNLRRNFANSVFAGATFNLGPRACTVPHTDHLNIPTGWCAVVALGDFDPDEGGHLILWDLKLMIRFPRGAVIFLPSALLAHSNTIVPEGQTRYSFTQYTAGGIARWVECGFMSQKEYMRRGHRLSKTPQERWAEGLARFPKWSSWGS